MGGAVQVDGIKPCVERKRLWFQRLKIQYDEPLLNFTFNFNLRRYNWAELLGSMVRLPPRLRVRVPSGGASAAAAALPASEPTCRG